MWIFCSGMIRSGSTIQYQLVSEIVNYKTAGISLGWIEADKFYNLQEAHRNQQLLYVVKCHDYIKEVPDLQLQGQAKVVYSYRDIRDVLVSLMKKTGKSFLDILLSGNIDSALENYYRWNKLNDIFASKYELMVNDFKQQTLDIAEYLGLNITENEAIKISNKFSMEKQREKIRILNENQHLSIKVGENLYDKESLLHKNHINSGKSEQWKTCLSNFQLSLMEDLYYKWLMEHDYEISQSFISRKYGYIQYNFQEKINRINKYLKNIVID